MFGCVFYHNWGAWNQFQKYFTIRDRLTRAEHEHAEIWQVRKCTKCGIAKELKVSDGYINNWGESNE